MKRNTRGALVAVLAAIMASACMTLSSRSNDTYEGPRTYSGTRLNAEQFGVSLITFQFGFVLISLVDFPFSFVADTLLLPVTIPEESARVAAIAKERRTDIELPAPVSGDAAAGPELNAKRLFDACVLRFQKLNPNVANCYAIGARVVAGEEYTGQEYKIVLREAMELLRRSGGFATYQRPSYTVEGQRVRIDAMLAASFLTELTPVTFIVGAGADGDWRVVEATGPAWP